MKEVTTRGCRRNRTRLLRGSHAAGGRGNPIGVVPGLSGFYLHSLSKDFKVGLDVLLVGLLLSLLRGGYPAQAHIPLLLPKSIFHSNR